MSNNVKDKELLLETFYTMSSNESLILLMEFKDDLRNYLRSIRPEVDLQLEHVQLVVDVFIAENLGNKFQLYTYMTREVVDELLVKEKLDITDIEILVRVIHYSVNGDTMNKLFTKLEEATKGLEEQERDNFLLNARLGILIWHFKSLNPGPGYNSRPELFADNFKEHLKEAYIVCDKYGYKGYKALFLVREGMIYKDTTKMKDGLSTLKEIGKDDVAELLVKAIKEILLIDIKEVD